MRFENLAEKLTHPFVAHAPAKAARHWLTMWFGIPLLGVVLLTAGNVEAASITLFNTGVDASGNPLPNGTVGDPHYSLIAVPSGSTATRVITSAGGYPIGPYIGDNTTSAWIGPNNDADLNGAVGLYTYRTTFDLTGFDPLSAAISGGWSTDNDGVKILLNGIDTGNPATSFTQFSSGFAPFSITSGFVAGLNTLDFIVNNGGGPTSLRVEMSGTAALVPIPAAVWLFGSALAAMGTIGGWRRRPAEAP